MNEPSNKMGAGRFTPRQLRLANALAPGGWVTRNDVDRITGSSNGPEVVRQIRNRVTGMDGIEEQRVPGVDRDGLPIRFGRYRLTDLGRQRAELAGLLPGGAADGERTK